MDAIFKMKFKYKKSEAGSYELQIYPIKQFSVFPNLVRLSLYYKSILLTGINSFSRREILLEFPPGKHVIR
jgi:hypothetical protein